MKFWFVLVLLTAIKSSTGAFRCSLYCKLFIHLSRSFWLVKIMDLRFVTVLKWLSDFPPVQKFLSLVLAATICLSCTKFVLHHSGHWMFLVCICSDHPFSKASAILCSCQMVILLYRYITIFTTRVGLLEFFHLIVVEHVGKVLNGCHSRKHHNLLKWAITVTNALVDIFSVSFGDRT